MRYIRTTDGRISYLRREPNEKAADYEMLTSSGMLTYRREDEVIKVADNVEELCDEFVAIAEDESPYLFSIYENNDKKYVYINEENAEPLLETFIKNKIIHGAIWAKGEHDEPILKSVAKMKGVLPNGEIDWELI